MKTYTVWLLFHDGKIMPFASRSRKEVGETIHTKKSLHSWGFSEVLHCCEGIHYSAYYWLYTRYCVSTGVKTHKDCRSMREASHKDYKWCDVVGNFNPRS